ncbi:MAG TPA: ABC transporter permease [Pirellulaceae bacterium]|nr:ABC transporter permease [Pirellulaceae bacterium]HMO91932.1 ABC transporter permease [Pirellulaceae bacterium]HMP68731.1 ABC transporter permease [Pirellulaceae bacterium]
MNSTDPQETLPHVVIPAADDSAAIPQDIRVSSLSVTAGRRQLLNRANAIFPARQLTLIVGPSGVGKSLLLKIIAGLVPRDHASIHFSGNIETGTQQQNLGVVFQSFALFDELTPKGNIEFAKAHRCGGSRDVSADVLLETLKIPQNVRTSLLSGGQRQRLAIARTLAYDPAAILYDEPTSGLDPATAHQVATIILETHRRFQKTSIVVTHDYDSLLPISDKVYILDPTDASLREIPKEQWQTIGEMLEPMSRSVHVNEERIADDTGGWRWLANLHRVLPHTSKLCEAMLIGLVSLVPTWRSQKWGLTYLMHYARLVAGPTAWIYMALSGLIIGFVTTYFVFRFLPFAGYTQPLLIEELLSAMGFSLYRIFIPVLATVMIAARSGAAITADIGSKQYGQQIDALQTINVSPRAYLLTPIMISFVIGTPLLNMIAFWAARYTSLFTFTFSQPGHTPDFWNQNFHYSLHVIGGTFYFGTGWLLAKLVCCGLGIGVISYFQGRQPKFSSIDVSQSVTATILWTTLYVLAVHFAFAFYEFNVLPSSVE